eukprot:s1290_g2.t3
MPFDAKYLPEHLRIQLLKEALRLDPDLKEEDLERGIILHMDDLPEQMNRAISREAFLRDLQWCPRNFLHRYRLAFKDLDDIPREAIAPLPDDLRHASASGHRGALGHYILGKTIGEGTFGKVKLGRHILTGERVAVKVADIERVAREVQLLKLIRHPHVVQLLEIIETKNQLYLIMEYASGGELFDYIVQHQRVPEQQACIFFHQIIAGAGQDIDEYHRVEKIHAMNVENLLLDEHKCIKIVDFGLSNRFETNQLLKTACGSPCYAPPEMVSGQSYDSNTSALYKKILAASYQPPAFISDSVKDLISGLLTVDPAKRFTIADVRAHPWYQQVPDAALKPKALAELPGGLDEDVLEELKRHGFPREYAINCLQNNKHNSVTTTYYLLAAKRRRMMEHLQMQQEKLSCVSWPGASREGGPSTVTGVASSTAPASVDSKITTRMVASPDPTHRVTTLTSPQMASPHISTPKSSPVVVTPNASMSRPCAPPSPSSISPRAFSPDKHPQAASPNSSRAVTPNASISRPMTAATHVSPISSRTPSHDGPKDSQLSPGTHARTTREAVQKGTPPTTVVPSSMCMDGQARYIIRPMSSKVSRLSSVPVSRHMVTGTVTAPATPRQTPMSARAPSRDSPADALNKRFTMVDASHGSHGHPSHVAPASPEIGRFEEISGTRQQVAGMAQKTSVAATYHLLAKRKKDAPPASPKPGASTLDQRPIERAAAKVKEPNMANVSNPKITPRQVLASPHYGVRQVITPRVAGSPVQVSRVVGSPAVTPRVSPMPRAMAVALDKLQPLDPWSASVMAQWLDPTWRCKAWNEIDVMPKEISDENIQREKLERFPTGEPLEVHERRIDPFDGRRYSLAQLLEKYKDQYQEKDIKSYWRNAMKPNEYLVVD